MSPIIVKEEIKKVIDEIPEETLEEILNYLKSILRAAPDVLQQSQHLKKILVEDRELLERLAK